MELSIQLVCPECQTPMPLNITDLAPGYRQTCESCQTPARMTHASLEQFSKDVRLYCESC